MLLATSLGALGALLYISYRVWRSLANAEPIDVFPLLRPFVLGLLIMNFTWVTGVLDGVAGAIIEGTEAVAESNREELQSVRDRLKAAEDADLAKKQAETKEDTAWYEINWDGKMLELKQGLMDMLRDFLQWLMEVAKLILYTVASFMLLIMTILGPVVFAFAIFDGFQQGLVSWIARYIHLSLWLPVANILQVMVNSIEIHMSNLQIASLNGGGKDASMWFMIMFYIIGLVAFTTVPTVSGWIVEAGSGGGGLTRTLTSMGSRGAALAGGAAGGAVAMGWKAGLNKFRAPKREQKRVNEIAKGIRKGFSDD
ncbi:putative conjugative transposon TraJ protein [Porphyromonas uenonis 60-3]|uniref:Putative conjugative transposon TraJ protein n=2 Tax=Porphyromonas uenonis TaxID=281920 RepID=C2MBU7_9PORP|nr:putative conjugative transposon TraJ protein [Porphyromonas uenonis 60-3]